MPIPAAAAANAYTAMSRIQEDAAKIIGGTASAPDSGPNFGAMLKDAMSAVADTAHKGDVQSTAVASGKSNMIDVVTAVAETETTFQTLISVRDKVIAAYEDVLKMQI
jgi:flagellar hook-basal body complex protein FliE